MRRSRIWMAVRLAALGGAGLVSACGARDVAAPPAAAGSPAGAAGASGRPSTAGSGGRAGQAASPGAGSVAAVRCADPALTWKTGNKTNYTSYPEPGSQECVEFSGCKYQGMFAACSGTKSEDWVSQHSIVAIFPDLRSHELHELCLTRADGSDPIIVTVYDTCADSDCDGCCSQNRGSADALIDVEHYTDLRWGVADGPIRWADLGPGPADACN